MFEDQVLKWKFKRGSDDALTLIYEKYLDSMLTLAMGLLNDAGAAEDVVQDVFVVLRAIPSQLPRAGQPQRLPGHQRGQPGTGPPATAAQAHLG